ncbi:MAG: GHMP kinase [Chitinivibrionales bacterium]|nr:GHMP kinase [Chitinivibrionales bacterium]
MSSPPRIAVEDTDRFLSVLNEHGAFFNREKPVFCARAPARLDLMGGIADYSGSLTLELPLMHATYASVQYDERKLLTLMSTAARDIDSDDTVVVPLTAITKARPGSLYNSLRDLVTNNPRTAWAAYVAGVPAVLATEKNVEFKHGLRILVHSFVPPASGISSSAALEVAVMNAVAAHMGIELDGKECAVLCQKVENHVVGAPCGIMDQMTSACGEQDKLLALLCQPAALQPLLDIPVSYEIWGINSGIRHAVSGADYGSVRTGAFMGYRMCAETAGFPIKKCGNGMVEIDDTIWNGYLANITPAQWESHYRESVPEQISGADFLKTCDGITDPVSVIDPQKHYAVRNPTAHPIHEHFRVSAFRKLMEDASQDPDTGILLGEYMYQSHASYSACGLGSDGTDLIVDLVRERGPKLGLYGAKITGGGSGGTVAVLAEKGRRRELENIVADYEEKSGRDALVIGGSSPGAEQFGSFKLCCE